MTEQSSRYIPQFYVTAPAPCPYLPDRYERKIFASLSGPLAQTIHSELVRDGFRRSQSIVYKPACEDCSACVSVRIPVDDFLPSKSQKRVSRRNGDLIAIEQPPLASDAQFALLRAYLDHRHNDGGMAEMTPHDYQSMVQDSPISSQVVEYHIGSKLHPNGPLAAACLTDQLDDGLSMVYSFFDPTLEGRSLGTHMILDHVRLARQKGLPFLYLGYWIAGCGKMDYKRRFAPLEFLKAGTWASAETHGIDFRVDEPLHEP